MKTYSLSLSEVSGFDPATARVLIYRDVAGKMHVRSTLNEADTIEALDGAMESIDGQRLPPDAE